MTYDTNWQDGHVTGNISKTSPKLRPSRHVSGSVSERCAVDLIGAEVEFKKPYLSRYRGIKRIFTKSYTGKIKKILSSAVIIEGENGALFNRPLNEITFLEGSMAPGE
jgi:hypothetical protein